MVAKKARKSEAERLLEEAAKFRYGNTGGGRRVGGSARQLSHGKTKSEEEERDVDIQSVDRQEKEAAKLQDEEEEENLPRKDNEEEEVQSADEQESYEDRHEVKTYIDYLSDVSSDDVSTSTSRRAPAQIPIHDSSVRVGTMSPSPALDNDHSFGSHTRHAPPDLDGVDACSNPGTNENPLSPDLEGVDAGSDHGTNENPLSPDLEGIDAASDLTTHQSSLSPGLGNVGTKRKRPRRRSPTRKSDAVQHTGQASLLQPSTASREVALASREVSPVGAPLGHPKINDGLASKNAERSAVSQTKQALVKRAIPPPGSQWTGTNSRPFLAPVGAVITGLRSFDDSDKLKGFKLREPPCILCKEAGCLCTYGTGKRNDGKTDRTFEEACDRCRTGGKRCETEEGRQKRQEGEAKVPDDLALLRRYLKRGRGNAKRRMKDGVDGAEQDIQMGKELKAAFKRIVNAIPKSKRKRVKKSGKRKEKKRS